MMAYIARRMAQLLPVLFLASVAVWALTFAMPGTPAQVLAGDDASPEQVEMIEQRLGLNRPIGIQYLVWLGNAVQGDLGTSITSHRPVVDTLFDRVPATFQLATLSMLVSLAAAFPIGVLAALRPRSWVSRLIHGYEAVGLAVPTFWLGLLLILFVSLRLELLPALADYVPFWRDPLTSLRSLALPALAIGVHVSTVTARFVTSSLSEALDADFVRTARSKGVPEYLVVTRHAMRNALLPTVTIVGLQFAAFLGGTVVVEVLFNYPGLGRLVYSAVSSRDYPVIQGAALLIVVLVLLVNLCIDLLYAVLDPRVRLR